MALSPFLQDVLRGGLPEALDLGRNTGQASDPKAEQVAPTGTVRGTEPVVVAAQNSAAQNFLMNVTQTQILTATVAVIGVLALIKFARG